MATGWFAPTGGFNCYFPMPFHRRARIELTNEHPGAVGGIYYQIDCTVDDELDDGTALFHAHWRRSNASTALAEDHVVLDGVVGSGNYVGTYIGLTALERFVERGRGEVLPRRRRCLPDPVQHRARGLP